MDDSSSRQEYPAMLDTMEPSHAVMVLNNRMKHVGNINTQIADWLEERRRIEDLYVSNLRKLAQKTPPDDSSDLGVFTTPWQKITSSALSIAESHHKLATRIGSDIEAPLRSFVSSNRETQAMTTMQGNLQALAKDYDSAQKKAEKLNQKGGKSDSTKVANASSDFENASSQWTSQAPYVFEALQAVDESRCNNLRDLLTQYETLEVDLVERNRKTAENTLNSLLNVETSNEIRTFAARNTGSATGATGRTPPSLQRPNRSSRSGPPVAASAAQAARLAPPSAGGEEISRQRSPSVGEEKKSRFGGLKRGLGTVVGRRKSMQPPFERKESRGVASSSNLGASVMSNGDQPTPTRNRQSDTRERPSDSRQRPSDPLGDIQPPPGARPQRGLGSFREQDDAITTTTSLTSQPNGMTQLQEPLAPQTIAGAGAPAAAVSTISRDAEGYAVPLPPTDPISQAQAQSQSEYQSFGDSTSSAPKALLRDAPIAEDEQSSESAMASTVARLREQAAQPRRTGTQRGRRDVRNTVFVPSPEPSVVEQQQQFRPQTLGSTEQQQYQPQVQNTGPQEQFRKLESPVQSTSAMAQAPSVAPQIFNTPFVSSLHSGQGSTSSSNLVPHRPSLGDEQANSDAQSIRSTGTMGTTIQHPALTGPGLTASIVETISAWQEAGSVTRAVVIGEVALAHNMDLSDPNSSAGVTTSSVRLENFSALEKVAPNPSFIHQQSGEHGEYSVDLTSIPRTSVAFKYQVHLDSTTIPAQAPLMLTPTWKIEPTQSSVILNYAPSPTLTGPVTLANIVVAIHLDGVANACLSKPTGNFNKERNMIYWRLDELVLTPGTSPQRLLARFQTEGEGKAGRVEARWELRAGSGLGSGLGISRLEAPEADPFADSAEVLGIWKDVSTIRIVTSGTYVAT